MRVFITGATGFVGLALAARLRAAGHRVAAWVRDEIRARASLGPEVELISAGSNIGEPIARADAIINLAGESIFAGRWTPARKRAIVESRVNLTRAIATAISQSTSRPSVFVSASAVGYYGDRGDEIVDDDAPPGNDFLATVCGEWEAAALEAIGTRVFIPRLGVVLGKNGGALPNMLTPFRFGIGGPIGSGRQYLPWIHLDDLLEIIVAALEDDRMRGPMIAAAPSPVTSRELARTIGAVLQRPSLIPVPAVALRILLGEASQMLLGGQRVRPRRLEELGFKWRFPTIDVALVDLL